MGISGVSASGCYQSQATSGQAAPVQEEQKALADALKEQEEGQKSLVEMMKEAREKAEEASKKRDEMLKKTTNRRYGDAAIMAYSKLARARSAGEVDAASGYARRQIAQLRAAKGSDPDNADRIQAAINQLQKAVNRAGRKKRELSQERLSAKRQARLEKEKRTREAKRLKHQLRSRQAQRVIRESGYLREAEMDNRIQDQLSAAKLELRQQMQELADKTQTTVDAAVQQYAAAAAEPAPAPEISVEA
ncbi:hypothetical protein D1641_05175 [Colidextribacter sp. OB.20]|uniref:hypothetical protein n=1 Tax=Colidextribacter sp. OB.20 TaxID=2304568 RepID=UPI00136BBE5D|nr:hypothetical protein [Colidextribacter sp. OB.20]NBI09413.1 hypothetical protein [Colidextribacter sp. OB.20]